MPFETIGIVVAVLAAWAAILLCLAGLAMASFRVSWMLVDMYGGYKTFKEFRHWYHTERKEQHHD